MMYTLGSVLLAVLGMIIVLGICFLAIKRLESQARRE